MATKKEKKLDHIQVKDNGIKLSQVIGDKLADIKALLEKGIIDGLLKNISETNLTRYRIVQNVSLKSFQYLSDKLITKVKKDVKASLKEDKTVNLTNKQVANMSSQINKGLLFLQDSAVKTYQDTLTNIILKSKKADDLKDQLQKHIESGINVGVVYKDGKNYKFDTYWEMKTRTDIQNEISENMVSAGDENGVIFYIAAYFGDCAKDHVDYQGKIYVSENWRSVAPKQRLDEIESYINSNKIMTVQDVMGPNGNYFTSRPNCRHYFQYISIDEVLGIKNNSDLNQKREENNLNFNGKYKPEKYEALQKQRLNERKIRAEKLEIQKQEQLLHLNPGDKEIQSRIKMGEANVKRYQAEQRELIKQYDNLERRYDREATIVRADFDNGSIKADFKFKGISKSIEASKNAAVGFNEKNSDIYAKKLNFKYNYHQYHDFEDTPKFIYHRKSQSNDSHIENRHPEIKDKVNDYLDRIPKVVENPEYLGKRKKDGSILVASSLNERSGLAVAISFEHYGIVVHSARYTSGKNWEKLIKKLEKTK